jgi:hypothetical protein
MQVRFRLFSIASLVIIMFVSHDVCAQSELQAFLEKRASNAEKVEVAGVEFRGRKSGPTKFTKCNGEVIDIGNQSPKKTGPCPQDGNPHHIFIFGGILVEIDKLTAVLKIRASDGNIYAVYLPEDVGQIIPEEGEPDSRMSRLSTPTDNPLFGIASDKRTRHRRMNVVGLRPDTLNPGDKITIVSLVNGRAEAVMRSIF